MGYTQLGRRHVPSRENRNGVTTEFRVDESHLMMPLPDPNTCAAILTETELDAVCFYAYDGSDDIWIELCRVFRKLFPNSRITFSNIDQLILTGHEEIYSREEGRVDGHLGLYLHDRLKRFHAHFLALINVEGEGPVWVGGMFMKTSHENFCGIYMSTKYVHVVTGGPATKIDLRTLARLRNDTLSRFKAELTPELTELFQIELEEVCKKLVDFIEHSPCEQLIQITYPRPEVPEWENVNFSLFSYYLHSSFTGQKVGQTVSVVYKPELDWVEIAVQL